MAKMGRPLQANYKAKEYWYGIFQEEQRIEKELEQKQEGFQRYLKFVKAKKNLQKLLKLWQMDADGRMTMYEGSFEALFDFLNAVGIKFEMESE